MFQIDITGDADPMGQAAIIDQARAICTRPGITAGQFESDELGSVSLMPPPTIDTARAQFNAAFASINSTVSGYADLKAAVDAVDAALDSSRPAAAADPTLPAEPAALNLDGTEREHPDATAAATAPVAL